MNKVITFLRRQKIRLGQFHFALRKTIYPTRQQCLGWGYSKAQSAIPILFQQNLGPWLAHMLLIGTSPNITCTCNFRAQQSFQFIYITYPNSAFSLPQILFVPPIQLFKLSQQHILYKHLLILISAKYL